MSDLLESQDIFYPRNFDHLHRKVSFSTDTGVITTLCMLDCEDTP